jgi:hypothetical protein
LIGLIVAMAIIAILSVWLYPRYMKPGGVDGSVASPEQDAQGIACTTYYNEIGDAIVQYKDANGHPPPNLQALHSQGVSPDMYNDPECGFQYDSQTGMLGDKTTPLPASPPTTTGPATATSAGTPGYAGVAPVQAQQQAPQPTSPGSGPNPDIYSKAAHSGDSDTNNPANYLGN